MTSLAEFRIKIADAVDTFDESTAAALAHDVAKHLDGARDAVDERAAVGILDELRRKRHYDLVLQVADALVRNGTDMVTVRGRYAHALINLGHTMAGITMANVLMAEEDLTPKNRAQIHALLGRAYKDIALKTAKPDRRSAAVLQAIENYLGPYEKDRSLLWWGVNACALLARADREGIDVPDAPTARDLGAEILATVTENGPREAWDHATAMEAALATDNNDLATEWLMSYLAEARNDAFALGSTLRQLTAVWELRADTSPGNQLVAPLQAGLLRADGGAVEMLPKEQASLVGAGYEALFSETSYHDLLWLRRGMKRCRAVGRVDDRDDAVGTGFLMDAKPFGVEGERLVFVTNAHVISERWLAVLRPEQATVTFSALDNLNRPFRVDRLLWESPRDNLDCAILTLKEQPPLDKGLQIASSPPPLSESNKHRAYIIGHPARRRRPQFSIQDNFLLDLDDRVVHYRSPTEPGSSGSPVFNDNWEVFAVHHYGSRQTPMLHGKPGAYEANEGIRIDAIVTACRQALSAQPPGEG
jgi:hypothetical protein